MKRDIKINYGKTEDIVYELNKYYEALSSMKKILKEIQQNLKSSESKAIDALSENFTLSDKNITTCQKEIEDVRNSLHNYKNEMKQYSQAVVYNNLMEADRNDIYWNLNSIEEYSNPLRIAYEKGTKYIYGSYSTNKDVIRKKNTMHAKYSG